MEKIWQYFQGLDVLSFNNQYNVKHKFLSWSKSDVPKESGYLYREGESTKPNGGITRKSSREKRSSNCLQKS